MSFLEDTSYVFVPSLSNFHFGSLALLKSTSIQIFRVSLHSIKCETESSFVVENGSFSLCKAISGIFRKKDSTVRGNINAILSGRIFASVGKYDPIATSHQPEKRECIQSSNIFETRKPRESIPQAITQANNG